ncbi:hypothetical protein P3T76_002863 [Phytophthora citrophthora]|uniref:Uncharacterized protein n=1 Tax=Phytophthora citrophthora TaxID=4793 RepID=A0AAD9LQE1_9STRA|nr:hypothetical protein P3T76_002863 [Phytophthora citrophthora]
MDLPMAVEYAAPDQSGVFVPFAANSTSESESVASVMFIMIVKQRVRYAAFQDRFLSVIGGKGDEILMDWCVAIRRITECSAALQGRSGGFSDALRSLLSYLEHEDVLVVYSAKEELQKAFVDGRMEKSQCVNTVVT